MSSAWWLATAAGLSLVGMGWLALAKGAHWEQAMRQPADSGIGARRMLRALGALALTFSLLACSMADRPSIAILVWVMQMTCAAVVVAMALARRPSSLAMLWPVSAWA